MDGLGCQITVTSDANTSQIDVFCGVIGMESLQVYPGTFEIHPDKYLIQNDVFGMVLSQKCSLLDTFL